jgi:S1-C subfamily serine protease
MAAASRFAAFAAVLAVALAVLVVSRPAAEARRDAQDPERAAQSRLLAEIRERLDRIASTRPDPALEEIARRMDNLAAEIAGNDGTLRSLRDAMARLKKDAARDAALLDRSILRPSVQVCGRGGVGGGTIIRSEPEAGGACGTYILTAFHVIQKSLERVEAGHDRKSPVQVKVFPAEGPPETFESDLLLNDERKDIALLKLRSTRHFLVAARLADRGRVRETTVFTPIYAVGCPLGHDPLPSFGEITTLRKEVSGERFWMMSAPTIFGNSGGGVFHRETLEMIGVSAMICTFDNPVSTPVPHLGILVPMDVVYDWLRDNNFGFLFDAAEASRPGAPARAAAGK